MRSTKLISRQQAATGLSAHLRVSIVGNSAPTQGTSEQWQFNYALGSGSRLRPTSSAICLSCSSISSS